MSRNNFLPIGLLFLLVFSITTRQHVRSDPELPDSGDSFDEYVEDYTYGFQSEKHFDDSGDLKYNDSSVEQLIKYDYHMDVESVDTSNHLVGTTWTGVGVLEGEVTRNHWFADGVEGEVTDIETSTIFDVIGDNTWYNYSFSVNDQQEWNTPSVFNYPYNSTIFPDTTDDYNAWIAVEENWDITQGLFSANNSIRYGVPYEIIWKNNDHFEATADVYRQQYTLFDAWQIDDEEGVTDVSTYDEFLSIIVIDPNSQVMLFAALQEIRLTTTSFVMAGVGTNGYTIDTVIYLMYQDFYYIVDATWFQPGGSATTSTSTKTTSTDTDTKTDDDTDDDDPSEDGALLGISALAFDPWFMLIGIFAMIPAIIRRPKNA